MNKHKTIIFISILFTMFILFLTIVTRISPGQAGAVVNLLGDNKGVETQTLGVGLNFTPPWKTIYVFPTYNQNHV